MGKQAVMDNPVTINGNNNSWVIADLTEEERANYFKHRSYGHPSSLMWRKFYFDVLKPNFL